jgi:hypothetical protein
MAVYVYEFLYRGRPNGDVAYHVILAEEVEAMGQKRHVERGPLTPEAAAELGFPLEKIVEGINAEALVARDRAIAEKLVAEMERDQVAGKLREATD